jgi:hypothetical protein
MLFGPLHGSVLAAGSCLDDDSTLQQREGKKAPEKPGAYEHVVFFQCTREPCFVPNSQWVRSFMSNVLFRIPNACSCGVANQRHEGCERLSHVSGGYYMFLWCSLLALRSG